MDDPGVWPGVLPQTGLRPCGTQCQPYTPLKGRESPQGDSVPLENPFNLERKQDGDADREGPPLGRRPLQSARGGDGYRLRAWSRFPDRAGLCETGASRTGVSVRPRYACGGGIDLRGV